METHKLIQPKNIEELALAAISSGSISSEGKTLQFFKTSFERKLEYSFPLTDYQDLLQKLGAQGYYPIVQVRSNDRVQDCVYNGEGIYTLSFEYLRYGYSGESQQNLTYILAIAKTAGKRLGNFEELKNDILELPRIYVGNESCTEILQYECKNGKLCLTVDVLPVFNWKKRLAEELAENGEPLFKVTGSPLETSWRN